MIFQAIVAAGFLLFVVNANEFYEPFERRPDLGAFQDEEHCFPYDGTWHAKYRNYESDPFFGGATKCFRATLTATHSNGTTDSLLEYGTKGKVNVRTSLSSSKGYEKKNVMNVLFLDGESAGKTAEVYAAYVDCAVCKVVRNSYIDENACTLLVPEHRLENTETACEFIFELLCGKEKYGVHDETCNT